MCIIVTNIIAYMEQYDKMLTKKLGRYLKTLRESKGVSLNSFAYENDLTTATVSRIENGLVDTKFCTLIKYARGLQIPLDAILSQLEIDYSIQE